MNEFKPFRQIPEWAGDETFIINGKQLRAIQDMFKSYSAFVQALEPVFVESLDAGKITIRYEDAQGNPMEKSEIDSMLELYAQSLAQTMNGIPIEEKEAS